MRRPPQVLARPVRGVAAVLACVVLAACGSGGDNVVAAEQSPTPRATPTGKQAPTPGNAEFPEYLRTAPPGKHPDPCGVSSGWDTIPAPHDPGRIPASQPADRVQRAAMKLYPDRFLEVYINDVARQYGVGVILYRLTPADEDRFFATTCFHRGDVVFVDGPVSPAQFKRWRQALMTLWRREPGLCESYEDRRAGMVHVTVQPGHPQLRRDIEKTVPTAHLNVQVGGCPVPL